ncbi:hypothetical protein HYW75_06150 [Candidatus Pacearchaeota archaeon]|nr:hypothetical protein [Candidatus Pacearchaeota archaeon]
MSWSLDEWWTGSSPFIRKNVRWTIVDGQRRPLSEFYRVQEERYRNLQVKTIKETQNELRIWMESLGKTLRSISNVKVSGAVSISLLTNYHGRIHTNTDLAVDANEKTLEELCRVFAKEDKFLVERKMSWKFNSHSETKHYIYYPITPKAVMGQLRPNMNLMFVYIDITKDLFVAESTMQNPIRLYLHSREKERIMSIEEKEDYQFEVPLEYDNPKPYYTTAGDKLFIMPLTYMYSKKQRMKLVEGGSLNQKHFTDLSVLETVLKMKSAHS